MVSKTIEEISSMKIFSSSIKSGGGGENDVEQLSEYDIEL